MVTVWQQYHQWNARLHRFRNPLHFVRENISPFSLPFFFPILWHIVADASPCGRFIPPICLLPASGRLTQSEKGTPLLVLATWHLYTSTMAELSKGRRPSSSQEAQVCSSVVQDTVYRRLFGTKRLTKPLFLFVCFLLQTPSFVYNFRRTVRYSIIALTKNEHTDGSVPPPTSTARCDDQWEGA